MHPLLEALLWLLFTAGLLALVTFVLYQYRP